MSTRLRLAPRPAPPEVFRMLADAWMVPDAVAARWWAALAQARWTRPVSWRQTVQLYRSCSLFLFQASPPRLVVDVVDDLYLEGRLTRQQSNQIMECVLRWVSPAGTWR
jgi:hypothetical protein